MNIIEQNPGTNETSQYYCNFCDYKCSKKTLFDRHLLTAKHTNRTKMNIVQTTDLCCICNKTFKSRTTLWRHKKTCEQMKHTNETVSNSKIEMKQKCNKKNEKKGKYSCTNCDFQCKSRTTLWSHKKNCNSIKPTQIDNILVIELLKQNQEFKQQIMELVKKDMMITNNINNNNITNNNNQNFNMNFFLNEQCKDALDIMDFVNSLQLSISDLENTSNVGYVKGVSDIFLRGLRDLDVYKRPIHCSDLKREVMYIKDNDVWEKDEDNKKVKKAIQYIGGRNFKQINEWVALNPESKDVRSRKHDQYVKILTKCTGGADSEEDETLFGKVITNVAKEVLIEKTTKNQ
jgi:hypothetical protein